MNCEKCGKGTVGYDLHDYCAVCSKNLCADCMAKGHCGHTPALSGMGEDAQSDRAMWAEQDQAVRDATEPKAGEE